MSRFSVGDLARLRSYLTEECNWIIVHKSDYCREYRAVTSLPILYSVELVKPGRVGCGIVLLKKNDGSILVSVAFNGVHHGCFSATSLKFKKLRVSDNNIYNILSISPLTVCESVLPLYSVRSSYAFRLNPSDIYDHAKVLSDADARNLFFKGPGKNIICINGCGGWCTKSDGRYSLITFALQFDLYLGCCDGSVFPSLASIVQQLIKCKRKNCIFCNNHSGHVPQGGEQDKSGRNQKTCLCYTQCRNTGHVNPMRYLPLMVDGNAHKITVRAKNNCLSTNISDFVTVVDGDGNPIPLKRNNWVLLKLGYTVSRLMVLSCPVLKSLVMT